MRVSYRTAALGCAFALCAAVFFVLAGQTGVLRFAGVLRWLLNHTEGYMLLAFGMGIFLVVISAQWNAIANHFRVQRISLAEVEERHPRLPRHFEISQTAALTLSFVILFSQFAAIVYAMAFALYYTTPEVKQSQDSILLDIDGDGDLDWVVGNYDGTDTDLNDMYRNISGSFSTHNTFGSSNNFQAFAAGDLNGDGALDLVVIDRNGYIAKYINDGIGVMMRSDLSLAVGRNDIALGDVDNDGDLDIVYVGTTQNSQTVMLNDGAGNFTSVNSTLPPAAYLALADFNSDGALDVATLLNSNKAHVSLNSGTGAFSKSWETAGAGYYAFVTTGDIDGDGDIDLLVGNALQAVPLFNNGLGTSFTAGIGIGTVATTQGLSLGDIDNDGDLDALVAGCDSGFTNAGNEFWLNNGTGVFSQTGTPTEEADCTKMASLGDLDGDGDLDYVAANGVLTSQANRIYMNDQSMTLPNAAPSAPTSGFSASVGTLTASGAGPRSPILATDAPGIGTLAWSNPGNVTTLNGSYAQVNLDMTDHTSHWLKATNFGFNIASGATIVGITASWNKNYGGCGMWDNAIRVVKRGTIGTTDKSQSMILWPSGSYVDYGGPTDLWGDTWTTSDINATNFGTALSATQLPCGTGNATPMVDHVRMTVYYYNAADIVLRWGSGSDALTPTKMLQYQTRVGTVSGGRQLVSERTASPNYVNRQLPNGQSRQLLLKHVPCGTTLYWSVYPVDTGLRTGSASSEQVTSLGNSCSVGPGLLYGYGYGGSSGGGGYWLNRDGQNSDGAAVPTGKISGQLFVDVNGNGKKENGERGGFAGLRVEAEGKDVYDNDVTQAVTAGFNGAFEMSIPAGTYVVRTVDPSGVLQGYEPTTKEQEVTVAVGSTAKVAFGWRSEKLLGYKPCLTIGEVNLDTGKPVSQAILLGIKNLYGQTLAREGALSDPLVSRKEFIELLAGTQCLSLTKSGDALREDLRAAARKNGWLSGVLSDVPVPQSLVGGSSWGNSAYALLAQGVPAGRAVGETLVADGNAPVTKREAMAMVAAMLGVKSDGELSLSLPPDANADDGASGTFAALKKAGVLPRGFEASIGGGVIPSEAADLLVKAAFAGGKLTLSTLPDEVRWNQSTVPDYLELAGTIGRRDCLTQDGARAVSVRSDILPNAAGNLFERLQLLLSVGTNDAQGRTRWLITGRPSEYGVKAGTIGLGANKAVTWVALADVGMKMTCHPLETFQEASRRLSGGGVNLGNGGTANMIFAPDRVFGTEDGVTYVQRLLHSFQRPIREFNLTPLAFAQDLTLEARKDFSAPVSQSDASRLLASYVLYTRVKTGAMTRLEAEGTFAELQTSILKKLTGISDENLWRMGNTGDNTALTWGQLITVVSDVLGPELQDTPLPDISTGEAWWNVISR